MCQRFQNSVVLVALYGESKLIFSLYPSTSARPMGMNTELKKGGPTESFTPVTSSAITG